MKCAENDVFLSVCDLLKCVLLSITRTLRVAMKEFMMCIGAITSKKVHRSTMQWYVPYLLCSGNMYSEFIRSKSCWLEKFLKLSKYFLEVHQDTIRYQSIARYFYGVVSWNTYRKNISNIGQSLFTYLFKDFKNIQEIKIPICLFENRTKEQKNQIGYFAST